MKAFIIFVILVLICFEVMADFWGYKDYEHRAWAFINLNKHYHCGGVVDGAGDWLSYGCNYAPIDERTFENYHKEEYSTIENMQEIWFGKPDPLAENKE